MKAQRLGTGLELLGHVFCLLSALCSVGITCASVLGIIAREENRPLAERAFFVMYVVILLSGLFCAGEYLWFKRADRSALCRMFSDQTRSIQKADRVLRDTGIVWLQLIFLLNLFFAGFIWGGDGHGLAGTWLFKAAGHPILISFLAMAPIRIQGAAWRQLLKQTGNWSGGPYE